MRTGDRTITIRLAGFAGGLFAASAVALSAYAMHATLAPHGTDLAALVLSGGIAAKMASRGELSLQKVREYGNVRKMINQ